LVTRHPTCARGTGFGEPRPQNTVGIAGQDRLDHPRDQLGLVLPVGVQHHDDVGTALQRFEITGALVAAVPDVVRVPDHRDVELSGDLDGRVRGEVVDHDDVVYDIAR